MSNSVTLASVLPMSTVRPDLRLVRSGPDWARVQAREPAALEALFTEWMTTILQWCRRLGGPKVVAEQAAQEVLLVVLRKVHTVRAAEAFPTWAYAVTRRVLAQQRRRAWVRRWDPGARVDTNAPVGNDVADAEARERARLTRQAVDALPDSLREVLVLCELEGLPQQEVAELLSLPLGTLKSRLRRARSAFAAIARERGLAPEERP